MSADTKVLSARWGKPDSASLASYRADGGYGALEKGLGMAPAAFKKLRLEILKDHTLRLHTRGTGK